MDAPRSPKDNQILDLAVQAGLVYWEGTEVYNSILDGFDVGDEILKFAQLVITHGQFIEEK